MSIEDLEASVSSDPCESMSPADEMRQRLVQIARELEEENAADEAQDLTSSDACENHQKNPCATSLPDESGHFDLDLDLEALPSLSHEQLLGAAQQLLVERDEVRAQLDKLPDLSRLEEMKERFEHAVAEIQWLRQRNSELESADADEQQAKGEQDWESQKEQWLSRLQNGGSTNGDLPSSTSEVVSDIRPSEPSHLTHRIKELEGEVIQLQSQLATRSAADEVLDQDELVRQERQKLRELQEEWKQKASSCELELSRERANLTRLRMELEERARTLDSLKERFAREQTGDPGSTWRSYLGIENAARNR